MSIAGALVMLVGAAFLTLATLGIWRFPDLYTRLHAATKAGPLGAGLVLLGAGLSSSEPWTIFRTLLGLVFFILTGPVSGHLLARAALKSGTLLTNITSINEWQNNK
jgi:multicomponent Na+:H+ antiporter subunit G